MNQLKKFAERWPVHLILMPLYFISHISLRFSGMLNTSERNRALLIILGGLAVFYGLVYLIFRSYLKAAIITTITGSFYLFFGDLKFTLSQTRFWDFLGHYKIYIPLLLVLLLLIIYQVWKTRSPGRISFYINLLFILYLGIDLIKMIIPGKNRSVDLIANTTLKEKRANSTDSLPDIYYILTDCYPSHGYQQEMLGIQNNFLDSLLTEKGFYVIKDSKSNYSNTAFSMASVFGMNYLMGVDTLYQMAPYYYNRSIQMVKRSPFVNLLENSGYNIYNLSIFDLGNRPALRKDVFLSISSTQIIFYNTAWNCIKRDLLWQLWPGYLEKKKKEEKDNLRSWLGFQKDYNSKILDSLSIMPLLPPGKQPVFLYAHLDMPHFPYFYDARGNAYPDELVFSDSMIIDKTRFAGYIGYANHKLDEIVSRLLEKTGGKAIIIVQSDHGLADMDWSRKEDAFRNFSAFYFPDKDYHLLYDSMSNVNTFRVLLNKYFKQSLPLLPDRSYYIK